MSLLPVQQQSASLLLFEYDKTTVDPVVSSMVPLIPTTAGNEGVAIDCCTTTVEPVVVSTLLDLQTKYNNR